jgi:hypothetical protein
MNCAETPEGHCTASDAGVDLIFRAVQLPLQKKHGMPSMDGNAKCLI